MKRIAVDMGGTFTDLVAFDDETGQVLSIKSASTPKDPSIAVIDCLQKGKIDLNDVNYFVHGTTVGVNAFLQRKGAKTGLITTKGFRDVLEIRRLFRPEMYDITYKKPPTLVPRYLRLEVTERMNYEGKVLTKLDEGEARASVKKFKDLGVESIAVCFLHSYANPAHETRMAEIIREEYPEVHVSLSHDLTREYREYERTSTAVIDAYTKPIMASYVKGLSSKLKQRGFKGSFLVTRSSGGAVSADVAAQTPVLTLNSGPAGGTMGAAYLGSILGVDNLVAIDAGGTSFDASMVIKGVPFIETRYQLESEFLLIPFIDIHSIGAGGGSIGWIDPAGAIHVGPRSAGADPGPMCYLKGGAEPTVTDAAVCLQIINPEYFLGGEIPLDMRVAKRGVESLGSALGMDWVKTAHGILKIATSNMAGAIREITITRGYDPRDFGLLSYGGAGAMFAAYLIEELSIPRLIIPLNPSHFSAWGMHTLDVVYDLAITQILDPSNETLDAINANYDALKQKGLDALKKEGFPPDKAALTASADMRYLGQEHTVNVQIPPEVLDGKHLEMIRERFNQIHELRYGYRLDDPVQIVTCRIRALGGLPKIAVNKKEKVGENPQKALMGKRNVYFAKTDDFLECNIYRREKLLPGNSIPGPAVVEEYASTTIVLPDQKLLIDEYDNIVIEGV